MKRTIIVTLLSIIITASILFVIKNTTTKEEVKAVIIEQKSIDIKDSLKKELTYEVDKYIKKYAKNSKLKAEKVVDLCLEFDISIAFVLAQGHLESHFGTAGAARTTNSIWGVGAFDYYAVDNHYKYTSTEDCLLNYLILLKEDYIFGTRDEHFLMNNYINYDNKRYATDPNYERKLKSLYNNIIKTTRIDKLQDAL